MVWPMVMSLQIFLDRSKSCSLQISELFYDDDDDDDDIGNLVKFSNTCQANVVKEACECE